MGRSLCPTEWGGSPETGVLGHRETPSQEGPKGSLGKPGKAGTSRAVSREICTSQLFHSSRTAARGAESGVAYTPSQHTPLAEQRAGPGSKQTKTADVKGGTGVPLAGRRTNLGSVHDPPGTAKRKTNNPSYQQCRQ